MVMIFLNDLAGVRGLPWWTYHLPAHVNGMTYVDMVFPFFLFIVGLSLPLAVNHRLSRRASLGGLALHVLGRSMALVILGVALANAEKIDPTLSHIGANLWLLLVLIGAILFWNVYPRSSNKARLFLAMKTCGLVLMLAMFVLFRRVDKGGHVAWLDFSYWEILGLIGWTYLAVCILYIPTRRWRWAPVGWCVVFCALNTLTSAHLIHFTERLPFYVWPWSSGCFCLICMAGAAVSTFVLSNIFATNMSRKALISFSFAAILFLFGFLLSPLGISKIRATPTWALYSAGAATVFFLALYWICDMRHKTQWAALVRPAGANTLLTYLLPDIYFVTLGSIALPFQWETGWGGVIKSAVFTVLMLGLAALLTKARVRLQV